MDIYSIKNKELKYVFYHIVYSGKLLPPNYFGSGTLEKIKNGYMGSVSSKQYKDLWKIETKNNPHLFKLTIISYHYTRQEAYDKEEKIQRIFNVVDNPLFVNMAFASGKGFFGSNQPKSEETKRKMSLKAKGKPKSKEAINKMSISKKGTITVINKEGKCVIIKSKQYKNQKSKPKNEWEFVTVNSKEGMLRRNFSEQDIDDFLKNLSEKNSRNIVAPETKNKISNSLLGKKKLNTKNYKKPKSKEHRQKLSDKLSKYVTVVDINKIKHRIPIEEYNKIKNLPDQEKPFFAVSSKKGMEILEITKKSHFSKREDGTSFSSDTVTNGTHNFLKNKDTVACYDKCGIFLRIPTTIYRNQTGLKCNWEWVSIVSKEGKLRKKLNMI